MTGETGATYKAFISYSWKDRAAAEWLHRKLEAYQTPKALLAERPGIAARLNPIFKDREEEAAGASLKAAIEAALDASEFLIVICSPNSAKSPWVNKEISYFRHKRNPGKILTYIIDGEPAVSLSPAKPGEECFAPALMWVTNIDGETQDMALEPPLSADARDEGDGRHNAKLKIAAAMLGVGLDDLVRRDAQRQAQRARMIVAGAGAVSLTMTALAGAALVSRQQAIENEKRAEREAMKATRTADFMVDLFEVADPYEANGRGVTAETILKKGVATIETELASEPEVQSTLMYTMGRAYTGLGLYKEAEEILDKAVNIDVGSEDTEKLETKIALARATLEAGDVERALASYKELLDETNSSPLKRNEAMARANILVGYGEALTLTDDPATAERLFRDARATLAQNGLAGSPLDASAALGLGGAIDYQGGRFAEAENVYLESITLFTRNFGAKSAQVGDARNDLATAYYFEKRLDDVKSQLAESLAISLDLLGREHPETLSTEYNLARLEYETGDIEHAYDRIKSALPLWQEASRAENFRYVFLLNTLGELQLELKRPEDASDSFSQALELAHDNQNRLYGPILISAGRADCAVDRISEGFAKIQDGVSALAQHYEDQDWRYGLAQEALGHCRMQQADFPATKENLKNAASVFERALGEDHYFAKRARDTLAILSVD
jgi:predicted negative regulator of RcsB-dependent stress response